MRSFSPQEKQPNKHYYPVLCCPFPCHGYHISSNRGGRMWRHRDTSTCEKFEKWKGGDDDTKAFHTIIMGWFQAACTKQGPIPGRVQHHRHTHAGGPTRLAEEFRMDNDTPPLHLARATAQQSQQPRSRHPFRHRVTGGTCQWTGKIRFCSIGSSHCPQVC
jgi:hypothetical protein